MHKPIDIIYILGSGHSGSTLTDLILGSHSCIESCGEVGKIAKYANGVKSQTHREYRCSCGELFGECDYWNRVKKHLEQNSSYTLSDRYDLNSGDQYNQWNYAVISSILETSGKKIFCDSSKSIKRLFSFLDSKLFRVHILHLVRDGRAVAFSHMAKQKAVVAELGSAETSQHTINAVKNRAKNNNFYNSIREWNNLNLSAYRQFNDLPNYFLLKYEDLANDPQKNMTTFLKQIGLSFESQQLEFYRITHHNIAGNRMRRQKQQNVERDMRYIRNLSVQQWWISTTLALAGLQKFQYPLGREKL